MRVIYRPHRGSLEESMALKREFCSEDEMFKFLFDKWGLFANLIRPSGEDPIDDERTGWHDARILVAECVDPPSGLPPVFPVGLCATDWEGKDESIC